MSARRHVTSVIRSLTTVLAPEVTYLLWDTAGQEEYDAITRAYYKARFATHRTIERSGWALAALGRGCLHPGLLHHRQRFFRCSGVLVQEGVAWCGQPGLQSFGDFGFFSDSSRSAVALQVHDECGQLAMVLVQNKARHQGQLAGSEVLLSRSRLGGPNG